jgi:N-terminal acetyltransferase B complex non-catalytic subunit
MEEIAASLERLHQSPVTDTRLLVYMYETCIESLRRMNDKGLGFNSIGAVALGCWQSTAKNMDRKTDRMALWNTLFRTAMQEDCWEDVRVVSCS